MAAPKRYAGVLAGVVVILALVALPVFCSRKEPVELGFVGGLSGRASELGVSGRNGALLAVEARNREGGIKGRPIRLVARDNGRDAELARRAVSELIERDVAAIIGHMTSTMSAVTLPLIDRYRMVMISPTATTDFLSGRDDYFFRVVSSSRSYATRMASHLHGERGISRVAIIYDLGNEFYTQSWLNDFRTVFQALGGEVVNVASFLSGSDVLFSGLARQALVADPGAIVFIANAADTALLSQLVRKIDGEIPLAAAEWAATDELIEFGGRAVEGMVLSQYFDRYSTDPAYQAFREAYVERFGQPPGFASISAYDAVNVILEAMEARDPQETLKESILEISMYRGVQGLVIFDRFGDAVRRVFLVRVRQGELRRLE